MYQTSEGEYKFIDVLTEDELKLKKNFSQLVIKTVFGELLVNMKETLSNVESKIGRELNKMKDIFY